MIESVAQEALKAALGPAIAFDVPMSKHTSLRIGGPADALALPEDRERLRTLLGICHHHGLPHTVVGAGFNMLIRDGGVEGVVINLKKLRGLEQTSESLVFAEAGLSHASLTRFCVDRGLSGLEFAAGIPGTVGGWLRMNAGIPDREQKDVVREIQIISGDGESETSLPIEELDFTYRALRGLPEGALIVSGLFEVEVATRESVQTEVRRLLDRRSGTQPLDIPSCGSVFRNPEGDHAGRLIEAVGLRGDRIGGAEISTVHANFITNRGGATAHDVLALIERIRERV
ncbi:MAG: UDP-N-acetylmuramate dehydrogenase, partial [Myxococcota bacterium]|nr:UDP-N-acetylmuramate dehydrogenase [Myxococcota bacterium]